MARETATSNDKIDQKRPAAAENELHKMQQRLVDDTVDDSFPASDPPAWTTSGQKSVAAQHEADDSSGYPGAETARRLAGQASHYAEAAYRRGGEFVEEARRRFPEAGRYSRQGAEAMARPVRQYPVAAVFAAAALGYGLAWLIHRRHGSDRDHDTDQAWSRPSGDSPKPHGDKYGSALRSGDRRRNHRL